jgi:aconitate hydratase
VTRTLLDQIVEAHEPSRRAPSGRRGEARDGVRVDHVLLGETAAPFVLRVCEEREDGPRRGPRALAWTGRPYSSAAPQADPEIGHLMERARRLGVEVVWPVHGATDPAYRERAAAPGRLAAAAGLEDSAAGALGTLVLRVGALEGAALLAGLPLRETPHASGAIELTGRLPAGLSGADLALEVLRLGAPREAAGTVIEWIGEGVASLGIADRVAAATAASPVEAASTLFPSDERTRDALRAFGREPEWRALDADPAAAYAWRWEIDLNGMEPRVAAADDLTVVRSLRHVLGRPVRRVVLGPGTDPVELIRLASLFEGRRVHDGVEMNVIVGSAAAQAALDASGDSDRLRAAGIHLSRDGAWSAHAPRPGDAGATVCWGLSQVARAGLPALSCVASPWSCAAAALQGELSDPRELTLTDERMLAIAGEAPSRRADEDSAAREGTAPAPVARGPLRVVVWSTAGDGVDSGRILPHGPRARPGPTHIQLFRGMDTGFAERARPDGSGLVLAGREFGGGDTADEAAWELARGGVCAVMAESYGRGAARALAHAGVLALLGTGPVSRPRLRVGDELEVPGLPETLEAGRPLVVRNLTRGLQLAVHHPFDAYEVDVWRAGGILPFVRVRAAAE